MQFIFLIFYEIIEIRELDHFELSIIKKKVLENWKFRYGFVINIEAENSSAIPHCINIFLCVSTTIYIYSQSSSHHDTDPYTLLV